MKLRTGDPWIPAPEYGRLLPQFTVNLIVRDVPRSLAFYRQVLEAQLHYADPDFAALRILGLELLLHADHTYEANPWAKPLASDAVRGLGAELRLLGMDPDALFKDVSVRGHGWREAMVRDPDGYVWAVGVALTPGEPPPPAPTSATPA